MRGYRWSRLALVAGLGLAVLAGGAPAWSKGSRSKENGTALWIAADRVVGFVPFTVSLYGRVNSSVEPDRLQLCREAAMQADFADTRDSRSGGDPSALPSRHDRNDDPAEPPCSTGTLVRTPDGYDYKHEMRFDRPGTYRVRLSMVDRTGHKAISNAVQVNAF